MSKLSCLGKVTGAAFQAREFQSKGGGSKRAWCAQESATRVGMERGAGDRVPRSKSSLYYNVIQHEPVLHISQAAETSRMKLS